MKRLGRISLILGAVYCFAVGAYIVQEHHSLGDAIWWAFMTFTTVGYGDQYPHTLVGRMAGMFLVFTAVFVAVPAITAIISTKLIGDEHLFTHEEQEEVKELLRNIHSKVSE